MSNKEFLSVPLNSINSGSSFSSSSSSSSTSKSWLYSKWSFGLLLLILTGLLAYCTFAAVDLYKKDDSLSNRVHTIEAAINNITNPSP